MSPHSASPPVYECGGYHPATRNRFAFNNGLLLALSCSLSQGESISHQSGGGRNISESTRHRGILDPSMIRSIKVGHGLLMLRAAAPIMLTLKPWTARADAAELRRDRAAVEETLRLGAAANGGAHA